MNVAGFVPLIHADATSETVSSGAHGYIAFGNRTDADAMPGGSATYNGSMEANEWQPRPATAAAQNADQLRGDLALTANFDRGQVSGRMHSILRDGASISGQLTLSAGRITGNGLTANLRGLGYTGSMKGAFYGPGAVEVGGTLRGSKSGGGMLTGWFAGTKE